MAARTPERLLFLLAAGLLLAGAALLRYVQLDRRPFHADEAVQAYQTWQLVRGQGYQYDPADKHGPFLYYAAAGLARVSGWPASVLDEPRLRLVPLLAGLGTLALVAGSAARLGPAAALVATALLAIAPLAAVYDTYFIQEAWFCFFTWALFFTLLQMLDQPAWGPAVLAGLLAGLMQATKETSVIHFAALGVTAFALRPRGAPPLPVRPGRWPRRLAALATALAVYVIFYSAFFTRWPGVVDGLRTYANYANRAAGVDHAQPWYYYLRFFWPQTVGGVHWGEPLLLAAALGGIGFAFSARASQAHRAIAVFTVTLLLGYSVIPYKTPWLLLTPYCGLALLAAFAVVRIAGLPRIGLARSAAAALCLGLVAEAAVRDRAALGRYASDERNPYLYEQTSAQFPFLVARLRAMAAQSGRPLRLAVVSPDHAWPLPWYLRNESTVGFFTTPPAAIARYDTAIYDSRLPGLVPGERIQVFGLRPNVLLWLTRPDPAK